MYGHASSHVATTTSAHSTRCPSRSCGTWSDASMPISSSAPSTLPCTAVPGALPADRAACRSPARARNSRSAMTERPLFATHTKSTFMGLGGERATDRKPFAHGSCGLDRSAGRGDDVLHDREPQTGAARRPCSVGAVEALEDAYAIFRPEADAVIGDGECRQAVALRHARAARASRPGVADRVRDEVLADDTEHARPQRQRDLLAADHLQGDLGMFRPVCKRDDDLAEDRHGLRRSERDNLATAFELTEKEHVVDELPGLLDLLLRLLEERLDLGVRKRRHFEERKQPGERCPKLVRDGGGESRPQLLVGGQFRKVADEEDDGSAGVFADPPARRWVPEGCRPRWARRNKTPLSVEDDDRVVEARDERTHPVFVHHPFTTHSPSSDPSHPPRNR